ncbi:MAG: family 1 glycosylhydrolase [Candidatus Dojkabacteria bacterium]|nr:family 1 glycosylhydrolase [Candidatus Dojkabacteria bacterium]
MKKFPKNFLWGSATAAYQVESNIENNWTAYIQTSAQHKAKNAKEDLKKQTNLYGELNKVTLDRIEDDIDDVANYIPNVSISHQKNYKQDIALAKSLNHNSYRFSLEWAKIEPTEGNYNQDAIEHYRNVIKELRENDIEPLVTLVHFTLPKWFQDKGAFENKDNIKYYLKYVKE